ncbi:hypothetical protein B0T10DRAFT_466478 [Thelonectria olida]|uniref:FAD-binding PCMH-type domain-containing protein n=1 Tax=Thelonectria olida TaxID=1576542 RepID=A0A9P9AJ07_9HYPO|nr:hypothetical protein B0T10DRAFT_466478 [Thelonectria olida]
MDTSSKFIGAATDVIGAQKVTIISATDQLSQADYLDPAKSHDMFHLVGKEHLVASAVFDPRNVPDVPAILKLCNEFDVPIWPFSIGRNLGYGGAAPWVPGSVDLNLGRHMNKILKVDVDGAYVLVEPGVSFADLHQYLVDNNHRDKL